MNRPLIFRFRCPAELKAALEAKAAGEMTSVSACIRRLLVLALFAEGTALVRSETTELSKGIPR
jgi:hypothetical protein